MRFFSAADIEPLNEWMKPESGEALYAASPALS